MKQTTQIYQVSDLTNEMKRLMETSYPEIWIEGELSSLSTPASGHLYFTLKDEQSQLRCAMFKNRAGISRYKAKVGDLVRVRAKISVYTARGELQCIVQHIEDAGEGVLQRRYEELKEKLSQAGLFSTEHKLTIPSLPNHIGLITSPTGAAIKDILSTLERRCPGIPVTIYPAVVQGDGAAKTLIQALANAIQHNTVDVIIMGRGGGSLEDLWCFNDEQLAQAIYQCPIPIVSAVGHEVDTTITDFVADLRAPTPTAAAELLSPDNQILEKQLSSLSYRLQNSFVRYIEKQGQRIDLMFQQLEHPRSTIKTNQQKLHSISTRFKNAIQNSFKHNKNELQNVSKLFNAHNPKQLLRHQFENIKQLSNRIHRAQTHSMKSSRQNFDSLGNQLHLVSPLATLDRGFSIARDSTNVILRDSKSSKRGDKLKIQLSSGELACEVVKVVKK